LIRLEPASALAPPGWKSRCALIRETEPSAAKGRDRLDRGDAPAVLRSDHVHRNHGCRWAFYDYSKNRSASWCLMQLCGNRRKIRAYRERHAVD
jgi:predicted RNA-binding Zn ribbon-like protein